MKKILLSVISFCLVLALTLPVLAADSAEETEPICAVAGQGKGDPIYDGMTNEEIILV